MITAPKRKAASIGANAIVPGEVREPSSGAKVAAAIFGVGADRRGQILAIRLGGQGAASAGAPADTTRQPLSLSALPVYEAAF